MVKSKQINSVEMETSTKENEPEKAGRKETYLSKNTLRSPMEYRTDGKP